MSTECLMQELRRSSHLYLSKRRAIIIKISAQTLKFSLQKKTYCKIGQIGQDLQNMFYPVVLDLVIQKVGTEGNQHPSWL